MRATSRQEPRVLTTALAFSLATVAFAAFAAVLVWPLPLHLQTHLPGDPAGDTGIYVWNLWVFSRELIGHGHVPLSTDYVFALTGGIDFTLHNYTPLADIFAVPIIPLLGVVGAYNVVLLVAFATNGLATYALSRSLGVRPWVAWVAGAAFMGTPLIAARSVAHLSLVCAAALPLFLRALLRCLDEPRLRNAGIVGAIVAAAAYSDAYFGLYCVLMGAFVVVWKTTTLRTQRIPHSQAVRRALNAAILFLAALLLLALAAGTTASGPAGTLMFRPNRAYGPALMLVIVILVRAWLTWQPRVSLAMPLREMQPKLRAGTFAVVVCGVLLSPILVGLASRAVSGRLPSTATFWRSSPRGVDALALLVPNPMHSALGLHTERWLLPPVEDAFPELVASCSLVVLAFVGATALFGTLPRMWLAFTGFFFALSLGPFIHVGGINTAIIGPWALLRYVPIIGMARSPARFAIVGALGLSILFAAALEHWLSLDWHAARRKRALLSMTAVLVLLAVEIVPEGRTLYSATVPEVYRLIEQDSDYQGRLLELPTGIRDGTYSLGDFSASAAFFQTAHEVPLIGGYVSRLSEWRKRENLRLPMMQALFDLSEGRSLTPEKAAAARDAREAFLDQSCVRYVVVDKRRTSSELRAFATEALHLSLVYEDVTHALLVPDSAPACRTPPRLARVTAGRRAARRRSVISSPP